MTTLFLLVTGVCQSLNELGVVSVTKKWSGQNRTSRSACYGPTCGPVSIVSKLYQFQIVTVVLSVLSFDLASTASLTYFVHRSHV